MSEKRSERATSPDQLAPLRVGPNATTKEDTRALLLREALPACQPQEGSIGSQVNAFTRSELEELKAALPCLELRPRPSSSLHLKNNSSIDICQPWEKNTLPATSERTKSRQGEEAGDEAEAQLDLDYFGAPRFSARSIHQPRQFRLICRDGLFTGPTNGHCPGFLQCNLVVLPQGQLAFDFLLFCQRNPKACPLIEVCDVGSPHPVGVARDADLRTDLPKYAIYRNGKLEKEVTDVVEYWPENSVAFLIGCSFSYDGAFLDAGIPLRSAAQGRNVPMYKTSIKCRPAGSLKGNMVVSMKPIPALLVAKEVEITSQYTHAHGGPVSIGHGESLGIRDIEKPDWGDAIDVGCDEVAVFHACGVTPQAVLMESQVPFAITHAAGHMFVTDLPADMRNP